MTEYADLEISLHRREANSYIVELRFSQPGSDVDIRLGQGQPVLAQFDMAALRTLVPDPKAYGQALTQTCEGEPGHFCFQEGVPMNIGEPVRELEVEPLLAPAVMPEAPAEPSVAPQPDFEPVEVPD